MDRFDVEHRQGASGPGPKNAAMCRLGFDDRGVRSVLGLVEIARHGGFDLEAAVIEASNRLILAECERADDRRRPCRLKPGETSQSPDYEEDRGLMSCRVASFSDSNSSGLK